MQHTGCTFQVTVNDASETKIITTSEDNPVMGKATLGGLPLRDTKTEDKQCLHDVE